MLTRAVQKPSIWLQDLESNYGTKSKRPLQPGPAEKIFPKLNGYSDAGDLRLTTGRSSVSALQPV